MTKNDHKLTFDTCYTNKSSCKYASSTKHTKHANSTAEVEQNLFGVAMVTHLRHTDSVLVV